jgi:D-arabinose 1-dehydrogenase-like Zn-dependent alcohol dehydrogenase
VALTAAYIGLYTQNPYGLGVVPPVTPEGEGKYAGNPIVILGGSSSVGQNGKLRYYLSPRNLPVVMSTISAIQLAKLSGFSYIITTASLKHTEYLKSLGATHVIDRTVSASALASEISNITQNAPIKYAVDSISLPDTQQAAYDLIAPGGQLVVFLPVTAKTTTEKDIFQVLGLIRHPANIELLETFYHDNLERLLKEGAIKVSYSHKCSSVHVDQLLWDSRTELKYCRTVLREYRMG